MKKSLLAMSIAALVGGLGFVGAASADVIMVTRPAAVMPDMSTAPLGATSPTTSSVKIASPAVVPMATASPTADRPAIAREGYVAAKVSSNTSQQGNNSPDQVVPCTT